MTAADTSESRLRHLHAGRPDHEPVRLPHARDSDLRNDRQTILNLRDPGAAQAARSASCRSAHERTLPLRITLPSVAVTLTRRASI